MRKLLPVGYVYWGWDCQEWDGYPFRILYIGLWCITIDRSHQFFERWSHAHINWNDAVND